MSTSHCACADCERSTHPALALEDEGDRRMVLLALARLSVERPGWDAYLNRIALRIDDAVGVRAELFDAFRATPLSSHGVSSHRVGRHDDPTDPTEEPAS